MNYKCNSANHCARTSWLQGQFQIARDGFQCVMGCSWCVRQETKCASKFREERSQKIMNRRNYRHLSSVPTLPNTHSLSLPGSHPPSSSPPTPLPVSPPTTCGLSFDISILPCLNFVNFNRPKKVLAESELDACWSPKMFLVSQTSSQHYCQDDKI